MRSSALGLITGLVAGIALTIGGFSDFVIVLVFGGLGLLIGKILDGEVDLSRYLSGGGRREPQ